MLSTKFLSCCRSGCDYAEVDQLEQVRFFSGLSALFAPDSALRRGADSSGAHGRLELHLNIYMSIVVHVHGRIQGKF
jgi:hypothetical protein